MKKFLSISLFISISLFSCSKKNVSLSVLKPAPITIGQHIKSVVLVDRTEPENKVLNTIEGILTGEGIGKDKQAASQSIAGLNQTLTKSPRFEVKQALERYKGSGSGSVMPSPLAWNIISALCEKYSADAVIVLETYDSDFIITNTEKDVQEKNADGTTRTVHKYYAEGLASVKLGYRMYDPKNMTITDQYLFNNSKKWNAAGNSIADAAAQLINRNSAVNTVSESAGREYGARITPLYTRVNRTFYKKGKNEAIKTGTRMADVSDWENALNKWKEASNSGDAKTRGRATLNVAVAYEVLGDLDNAKLWAQKAYTEYNNKIARQYVGTINQRMNDEARLKDQLGN